MENTPPPCRLFLFLIPAFLILTVIFHTWSGPPKSFQPSEPGKITDRLGTRHDHLHPHHHGAAAGALSVDHKTKVPRHPLDPLTFQEITAVRSVLSSYPPFAGSFPTIHWLSLEEPDKPAVLRWRRGDPLPPRRAAVVALLSGHSHVLTVDLASTQVVRHVVDPSSGYPSLTFDDRARATSAAVADAAFLRAVGARGVDPSDLSCSPLSTGWYGPREEGRRLVKVQCYSHRDTANFYIRPLEGLTVLVDVDTGAVLEVSDKGRGVPIPGAEGTDYRYEVQRQDWEPARRPGDSGSINPMSMEQLKGPSVAVDDGGHTVRWAGWEFHLRPDPRAGLVVSKAEVADPDTGERRSVLYKGMASELFVPYMDPTEAWYFKTYMDVGEYGFGLLALPLVPLNDCPRNAYYMDGVFTAADGRPFVREKIVCMFERYAGDVAWRHAEMPIAGTQVI